MLSFAPLLAFVSLASQNGAQTPAPGQAPSWPTRFNAEVPTDLLNWSGFGYLPAGDRVFPQTFKVSGDWSEVAKQFAGLSLQDAAVWKMKVVVFTHLGTLQTLPDGTLKQSFWALEKDDLARVQRELDLVGKLVAVQTGGKVRLDASVSFDNERERIQGDDPTELVRSYLEPRINGGKYESEDKVYRGPYQSVLVIQPAPFLKTPSLRVNGTHVSTVSALGIPGYESEGVLAENWFGVWVNQLRTLALQKGVAGPLENKPDGVIPGVANPSLFVPGGQWASIIGLGDEQAQTLLERWRLPVVELGKSTHAPLASVGFRGANTNVGIAPDSEKGNVLVYSETGTVRNGGVDFPVPKAGGPLFQASKAPTFSFWVKSVAKDPLSIRISDDQGKTVSVSIGRQPSGEGASASFEAPFTADGTWRKIAVDLKSLGVENVTALALGPSDKARNSLRATLGPIQYAFADFKVSSDAADTALAPETPSSTSSDPVLRAMWAHSAQPSDELLKLLKDTSDVVRLNAVANYAKGAPAASDEIALAALASVSYDPWIIEYAIQALSKVGTESANATIHRLVRVGVTEATRAAAALAIAAPKDPKVSSELIPLLDSRSLLCRISAVRALSMLPGRESSIIRMTFLQQSDPELKLEVTKSSDPKDDYQMRKMLWSAVNEPSDAVRALSCIKLIQSGITEFQIEGYKGVRDDSVWVRLLLLDFFAKNPEEAHRGALRIAVTDRSPRVRAAAILAFGALEKGATSEELGNALTDKHPDVQLALIELASHKGLKLPTDVILEIMNSPDPRVKEARKGLSN